MNIHIAIMLLLLQKYSLEVNVMECAQAQTVEKTFGDTDLSQKKARIERLSSLKMDGDVGEQGRHI